MNCAYHCGECHSHFTSLEAFDAHRAGVHANGSRQCVEPDDVHGLTPATTTGTCAVYDSVIEGVAVIYTTKRSLGRAEVALRTSSALGPNAVRPSDDEGDPNLGVAA